MSDRASAALLSLDGLSVGDAFGMTVLKWPACIPDRVVAVPAPWRWTDDTHMALSIVEVLLACGRIDQDRLAARFTDRFHQDPRRGYGHGARQLLYSLNEGGDWRELTPAMFDGTGSYGNGAAMRAGPIGAWFADQPDVAAEQAALSATVTHTHPEGIAGAIAVAVAAAIATTDLDGNDFLDAILPHVPQGHTRMGIALSREIAPTELERAIRVLGTGRAISAQDTVPFCLWIAAHHGRDFEEAMWATISGLEDGDTTCAIVSSIIAARSAPPPEWLDNRESLPSDFPAK